jgi:ribosomal-protein-alanine N-acetyltransferase
VARLPAEDPEPPIVGYLCLWLIADEVHVTNFAVDPTHRQRGFGRHLLGTLLELYRRNGARRAALEVRPSNHSARRLYEAFGFRQVGLRKGYYFDTGEDALLMEARFEADGGEAPPAPATTRRASGNSGAA